MKGSWVRNVRGYDTSGFRPPGSEISMAPLWHQKLTGVQKDSFYLRASKNRQFCMKKCMGKCHFQAIVGPPRFVPGCYYLDTERIS